MKTVKVVAAIIIHENKVFATQRGYGEFKDGWEFPGGKVEPGETPREAVARKNLTLKLRSVSCLKQWNMIIRLFICPWIAFCAKSYQET